MQSKDFWEGIHNNLIQNKKIALAIVFDADHSTPGRKGFKMFVTSDGEIRGSVGGGLVEAMAIEECKNLIENPKPNFSKEYKLLGNTDESIGMICNGVQIIGYVMLDSQNAFLIKDIINHIETNKAGIIRINDNSIDFISGIMGCNKFSKEIFEYTEVIGVKSRIYIFGGGHVGLAVSRVMSQLDFYVVVIDNRKEAATLVDNKFANEIIIKDYVEAVNDVIEDEHSYIVIVTPGHIQDKEVLKAVLEMSVKYIGMMGSESKVKTLYKELISEGISQDSLARIHSPIGIKIKSETPEEIAISIAAEIIGIKNKK